MSASRQLNNLESKANVMRVAGSIRRGSTLRSWYSASCRRRKRFSAAIAFLGRMSRPEIDDEISDQLRKMRAAGMTSQSCHKSLQALAKIVGSYFLRRRQLVHTGVLRRGPWRRCQARRQARNVMMSGRNQAAPFESPVDALYIHPFCLWTGVPKRSLKTNQQKTTTSIVGEKVVSGNNKGLDASS